MFAFRLEEDPARWIRYDEVDSTNSVLLDGEHESGTVCIARRQTGGRGRLGRQWLNPDGSALLFSAVVIGAIDPGDRYFRLAPFLVGAALLGAVTWLRKSGAPVRSGALLLKWPNDLFLRAEHGERKLAGVLLESRIEASRLGAGQAQVRLVLGVGVNWQGVPVGLRDRAVDLFEAHEVAPEPEELVLPFVKRFGELAGAGPDAWLDAYRNHDLLRGRKVRLAGRGYTASGIDERGRLILTPDGGGPAALLEDTQPDLELL